jgi:hypothetical protein
VSGIGQVNVKNPTSGGLHQELEFGQGVGKKKLFFFLTYHILHYMALECSFMYGCFAEGGGIREHCD